MTATHLFRGGDNGRTVEVPTGTGFAVALPESPTTGYRWSDPEYDQSCMTFDSDDYIPAPGAAIGGAGTRSFTFTSGKACRTTIRTALKRSWEQGAAAESTFVLTVVIGN